MEPAPLWVITIWWLTKVEQSKSDVHLRPHWNQINFSFTVKVVQPVLQKYKIFRVFLELLPVEHWDQFHRYLPTYCIYIAQISVSWHISVPAVPYVPSVDKKVSHSMWHIPSPILCSNFYHNWKKNIKYL